MSNRFLSNYLDYLHKVWPNILSYIVNNEIYIKVPKNWLYNFIYFLKKHSYSRFDVLVDICGVDFLEKKNRLEVVYSLLSITYNARLAVTVQVHEKDELDSLSSIYKGAVWQEREVWDMYGIFFKNEDLRRILTDYGFKGHPLRKDFPLTGFTEVRYSHISKKIVHEKVSLSQAYRSFTWKNINTNI